MLRSSSEIVSSFLRKQYSQINAEIEARNKSVAMAVHELPGGRCESFGTGFFYLESGWPFFITAEHVVTEAKEKNYKNPCLITRGEKNFIPLFSLDIYTFSALDLAIAPLWRINSEKYSHIAYLKSEEIATRFSNNSMYAFTGFPCSQNKTYTGNEIKAHQRVLTMDAMPQSVLAGETNFLDLKVDKRELKNSALQKISMMFPEALHGMSGGPVFEIESSLNFCSLKLAGIGVSWSKEKKVVKIAKFDQIDALLQYRSDWL